MNYTAEEAVNFTDGLLPELEKIGGVEILICPPFTALASLHLKIEKSVVKLGAQNLYWEAQGAYTGEISPSMIAELCEYVILGHSERRKYFAESDENVNRRAHAALGAGLRPIVCIGETLADREAGKTIDVVERQLRRGLSNLNFVEGNDIVIAYEPVWAIGTGLAASFSDAQEVIGETIRTLLVQIFGAEKAGEIRILYGGSIKPENAREFFSMPDIDGGLIGGASLDARSFAEIAASAA